MPRPEETKPREKKTASTMSQMTSFVNATNASLNESVLEITAVVSARKQTPPVGSGSRTSPAIVAMKMASRLIAPGAVPAGAGSARTASPMPTVAASAPGFAERRGATGAAASFAATRVLRFTREGVEARGGTAAAVGARQADIETRTSDAFMDFVPSRWMDHELSPGSCPHGGDYPADGS